MDRAPASDPQLDLRGVIPGVALPLLVDRSIDWDSLGSHLDALVAHDIAAVVVNADTGEGTHLSPEERSTVIRFAVDRVGSRVPVLAGLAAQYTAEAERLALDACRAGARGLQVFAPAAFQGSDLDSRLPYEFHRAIANAASLPVIVYQMNLPCGADYTREVILRLAEIPQVVAIKESSLNRAHYGRTLAVVRETGRLQLLSGADTFLVESLRIGADAPMLAIAATTTERYVRIWRATQEGDWKTAEAVWQGLLPIVDMLFASPFRDFRARLKELLRLQGVIRTAAVRPPLAPLSSVAAAQVRAAAEAAGLELIDGGGTR